MICPKCGARQVRLENPDRYICPREHEHEKQTGRRGRPAQSTVKRAPRRKGQVT